MKYSILYVVSLLFIFAVYFITIYLSIGYHHPDEHYQLIEFAGLKGGWNTGANLTWEYDAQIRPALQPMIALSVFQLSGLFGVESPFLLAMGLRFLYFGIYTNIRSRVWYNTDTLKREIQELLKERNDYEENKVLLNK